jgi:hypothetical protein
MFVFCALHSVSGRERMWVDTTSLQPNIVQNYSKVSTAAAYFLFNHLLFLLLVLLNAPISMYNIMVCGFQYGFFSWFR